MEEKEYLNIGCGNTSIKNAVNMDIAKNEYANPDIVGNVLDIPFPNERFKGIILSHILEHLSLSDHSKAMLEMRRVLKPKGKLLIGVPDFEQCLKNYLENYLGQKDFWYKTIYGRGLYESDRHLCGITNEYLTDLLFTFGFGKLEWGKTDKKVASLVVLAEKAEEEQNDTCRD